MPIKCGGGPQKIMYLSEDYWRRKTNVRANADIHWFTTVGNLFPNCEEFAKALAPIAASKNINTHFLHQLTAIDKDNRRATMRDLNTGTETVHDFDFLHFCPPQSAPEFIRENQDLAAANGWLDVDIHTLQHNKFKNVFGCGDICNLPTAKTAAAIFSQAPAVVHNLLKEMALSEGGQKKYHGYSSCPVFVGDDKLMLIEFAYGAKAQTTFFKDQTKPNHFFYRLKKNLFPAVYWNLMPRGLWSRPCKDPAAAQ